jgi:hypothetical protein
VECNCLRSLYEIDVEWMLLTAKAIVISWRDFLKIFNYP